MVLDPDKLFLMHLNLVGRFRPERFWCADRSIAKFLVRLGIDTDTLCRTPSAWLGAVLLLSLELLVANLGGTPGPTKSKTLGVGLLFSPSGAEHWWHGAGVDMDRLQSLCQHSFKQNTERLPRQE